MSVKRQKSYVLKQAFQKARLTKQNYSMETRMYQLDYRIRKKF